MESIDSPLVDEIAKPESGERSPGARELIQKVGAEFVGTFALLFVGCGAIMVNELTAGVIGHLGIGISFGLVIMVMIYATGRDPNYRERHEIAQLVRQNHQKGNGFQDLFLALVTSETFRTK